MCSCHMNELINNTNLILFSPADSSYSQQLGSKSKSVEKEVQKKVQQLEDEECEEEKEEEELDGYESPHMVMIHACISAF